MPFSKEFMMIEKLRSKFLSAVRESAGTTVVQRTLSYLTWTALAVALVASVMSLFGICSGACTDAEKYRIFGLKFGAFGIPFFLATLASSISRNSRSWELRCPYDALMFGAAGAEWFLVSVQKYIIGHYCPVCLAIAISVYAAVVLRLLELMVRKREGIARRKQGIKWFVASFVRGGVVFCALFVGMVSALLGTNTPTMASAGAITQNIWLGAEDKPVEVLFVSDWFCPYCKKAEPAIEKMLPAVGKVARYTFIDDPIHPESFNYMAYNMSLLLNYKGQYLEGRKVLLEFAERTKAPKEADVVAELATRGIAYKPADKSQLVQLANAEGGFLRASSVNMTPSVVVRNRKTGEHRLLTGIDQIREGAILEAVKTLGG